MRGTRRTERPCWAPHRQSSAGRCRAKQRRGKAGRCDAGLGTAKAGQCQAMRRTAKARHGNASQGEGLAALRAETLSIAKAWLCGAVLGGAGPGKGCATPSFAQQRHDNVWLSLAWQCRAKAWSGLASQGLARHSKGEAACG